MTYMTTRSKPRVTYKCSNCKDRNYLIECKCDLKDIITLRDNDGRFHKYRHGHIGRLQKRENHSMWKGGRSIGRNTYVQLNLPIDLCPHRNGQVLEHVYFYEQYHKLCMLKWGNVHHIVPIKEGGSNLPYNLQGMMKRDHASLHHKGNTYRRGRHKDMSNRSCNNCHTNKTSLMVWRHLPKDKVNWYCKNCYRKLYERK